METIFMNTENSKKNEPHRFKLDLTDKLNLKNRKKNMALANLSICYTWKNIKSKYNNNKFRISAPAWNDTFDLPNGPYSISDIQDYFRKTTSSLWNYYRDELSDPLSSSSESFKYKTSIVGKNTRR